MEGLIDKPQLPTTDSIHELAEFWDTHDLTDFEAELEEVADPLFVRPSSLMLGLDAAEAAALQGLAKSRGLSESELVRQWIRQHLHAA